MLPWPYPGLIFVVPSSSNDELWRSDGTAAGTFLVKAGLFPLYPTAFGGTLFFSAQDDVNGRELWKSDGTEAGTVLFKDINPGEGSSHPGAFVAVGGTLFFSAEDDATGGELWQSDGTAAGTMLVADIWPGPDFSSPNGFTAIGGTLFFVADDGVHGGELWKLAFLQDADGDGIFDAVDEDPAVPSDRFSDGTTSGRILSIPAGMTVQIADLADPSGVIVTVADPGATGSQVRIRLDGKGSTIKLTAGTYEITDPPPAVTTVKTTAGGPAEVELVVGGALVVVVIEVGAQATIEEIDTDGDGTVDDVVVTADAGTITVNGTPLAPGESLNLAKLFNTKLAIVGTSSFDLKTVLDPGGPVSPLTEPVGIRVGTFSQTIPAGSFVARRGKYRFEGVIGSARLLVWITPQSGGRYGVDVHGDNANLAGTANPVTVQVTIGDDSGTASVRASFK